MNKFYNLNLLNPRLEAGFHYGTSDDTEDHLG